MNQDYVQILAAAAVNSTAKAAANATEMAEPTAAIQLFSGVSLMMLLQGYATYDAYTTFTTTLNTSNVSTKTLWTTTWLQASTPLAAWFYLSKAVIAMNAISMLGAILGLAGKGLIFFRIAQGALIWPLMEIPLLYVAYSNYSACSTLASSNFAGTTDTSQYSSCTGGSDSEYGDSGTIAIKVNDDPYEMWLGVNGATILMHTIVTYMTYPKFATYYMGMLNEETGPPQEDNKAYDEEWQESQEFGTPEPETGAEAKKEDAKDGGEEEGPDGKEEPKGDEEPAADWGQNNGWGDSGGWGSNL